MKKTAIQTLILSMIPLSLFLLLNKFAWAEDLSAQLKGRILLQVEERGEAWYVYPADNERYFMGRPADAFDLMKKLGLGISNDDFKNLNKVTLKKLAGRILIKVQDKGRAYYINPVDLKIYYLGRPADAFKLMRELGLGIKNTDLAKIKTKYAAKEESKDSQEPANQPATSTTPVATTTEDIAPADVSGNATTSDSNETDQPTAAESCKFLAEYYKNISLSGGPSITRLEDKIDYNWGKSSPLDLGRKDSFSVRWTANCDFLAGNYKFKADFDDAMIVYVDSIDIIRSWKANKQEKNLENTISLTEGKHSVVVEYYEVDNNAVAKVSWEKAQ